jgi:hypothetical protein
MSFIRTGDKVMPSVAICAARFAAQHGFGSYGVNLFANTITDPKLQDSKDTVCYFDSDADAKQGGTVRTLAGGPTWYVDQLIIQASSETSANANLLLRNHVNFLCSVRNHPVFYEEDQLWYKFVHVLMAGRARRVGKTPAGMELYEAILRINWRLLSTSDSEYETVTGISLE